MIPNASEYRETARFGRVLKKDIADEIRKAEEADWNPDEVETIRSGVRKYFLQVSRLARWTAGLAFAPLFPLVWVLTTGSSWSVIWLNIYGALLICVGLVAIIPMVPAFGIAVAIRRLPTKVYRDLLGPLWANLDLFHVAVSAGLFFYILSSWSIVAARPIVWLLAVIWIAAPWILYLLKFDIAFIAVKLGQLGVLLTAAMFAAASPVPMSHYQRWAQIESAKKLRPVEQREVTDQWEHLQWFTQEGAPNIWYSSGPNHTYRLFTAPGHDPSTNEELKPVADAETRDRIGAAFVAARLAAGKERETAARRVAEEARRLADTERKQADEARALRERQEREAAAAEIAREEEARRRREEERIAAEKKARQEALDSLVTRRYQGTKTRVAVVVTRPDGSHDIELSERFSAKLEQGGLPNDWRVFRGTFVGSEPFRRLMGGDQPRTGEFNVGDYCDYLLVIEIRTANEALDLPVPALANDVALSLRAVLASDGQVGTASKIKVRGVGFNEADAKKQALERADAELTKTAGALAQKISSLK